MRAVKTLINELALQVYKIAVHHISPVPRLRAVETVLIIPAPHHEIAILAEGEILAVLAILAGDTIVIDHGKLRNTCPEFPKLVEKA